MANTQDKNVPRNKKYRERKRRLKEKRKEGKR
jgi:hypothetical protein